MIIDKLDNAHFYFGISSNIKKAFDFIFENDLKTMPNGKYQIDGDNIFAIVQEYQTKKEEGALLERHKKHIDLQYIVSGTEKFGYANVKDFEANTDYSSSKDIVFGKGNPDFIKVKEGYFFICTPEDAHMPAISADKESNVKKVVIKIKI